jgi:hypothetical protein
MRCGQRFMVIARRLAAADFEKAHRPADLRRRSQEGLEEPLVNDRQWRSVGGTNNCAMLEHEPAIVRGPEFCELAWCASADKNVHRQACNGATTWPKGMLVVSNCTFMSV